MIYILAYLVIGISTAVSIRYNGANGIAVIAVCFTWPLYWFAFIFAHFVGWMPAKCAWCGKSVAGHANMDKWRAHYLDECGRHPLAIKCKRLERYLDETDAKNTANRVMLEEANKHIAALETEMKPYREMTAQIQKNMIADIDLNIINGEGDPNDRISKTSKWDVLHG